MYLPQSQRLIFTDFKLLLLSHHSVLVLTHHEVGEADYDLSEAAGVGQQSVR